MSQDDLIQQMQRWGLVKTFVQRDPAEPKPVLREHIIQRTRRFAPLTRKRAAKQLVKRDGGARRRIVAKAAGVKGMGIVPKWSNDPIPCTETRCGRPTELKEVLHMPAELQWIDAAVGKLTERAPILGLVVRAEFTGFGATQKERAVDAQKKYGGDLTYWMYRRELDKALSYLEGFRSAVAA